MSIEIPTVEMAKCEGCGEYHPVEECEIVVIRIVKGKNCSLPSNRVVEPRRLQVDAQRVASESHASRMQVASESQFESKVEEPAQPVTVAPKRTIIPPGFASMMLDPGHPNFESHGAKETRRV